MIKMKYLIAIGLIMWFTLNPQPSGKSQSEPIRAEKDTIGKVYMKALKDADTTKAINRKIDSQLSRDAPKVIYRRKTIVKHVPVKVVVHDTVYITETKVVSVPTKDYYYKHILQQNDSIKQVQIDSLKPKKHGFIYRIFHKKKKQ